MYAEFSALSVALAGASAFIDGDVVPLVRVASVGTLYVEIVVSFAWTYAAWKGIPESHRGTMSPHRAWSYSLIPLYGVYWAFVMNLALCDTLNGIVAHAGSDRRAPRALGVVGNFLLLATSLFVRPVSPHPSAFARFVWLGFGLSVVGHLVWFVYMVSCDAVRDEVARLSVAPEQLSVPRLSRIQQRRSRASASG